MKMKAFTLFIAILAISVLHAQDLQIHKTDGTVITVPLNAIDSITFIESGGEFVCGTSTVTDSDGNVYNTVLIGNQCWMKENLKTTKYRNGTPIEYPGNDNSDWQNNTTGAYAWFDNDIVWKDLYGALYNWHASNNTNGLCFEGWRIPSDTEWNILIFYIDPNTNPNVVGPQSYIAGGALKSTRTDPDPHPRWDHLNVGATNESGFTGLPGGFRTNDGIFNSLGKYGYWWSSTEFNPSLAYARYLYFSFQSVGRWRNDKREGISVRCLKNN